MKTYKTYEELSNIATSNGDVLDKYHRDMQQYTFNLLKELGVSNEALYKLEKGFKNRIFTVDDYCRIVYDLQGFTKHFSKTECIELINAYMIIVIKYNSRPYVTYDKIYKQLKHLISTKEYVIFTLNLDARVTNILIRYFSDRIHTKEDFLSITRDELKHVRGVGKSVIEQVLKAQDRLRNNELEWEDV